MIDLLEALQPDVDLPVTDWPVRRRRGALRWGGALSRRARRQHSALLQWVLALCALGGVALFVTATFLLGRQV